MQEFTTSAHQNSVELFNQSGVNPDVFARGWENTAKRIKQAFEDLRNGVIKKDDLQTVFAASKAHIYDRASYGVGERDFIKNELDSLKRQREYIEKFMSDNTLTAAQKKSYQAELDALRQFEEEYKSIGSIATYD